MPDAAPATVPLVAYLACPIPHDDGEAAVRCIRRRFALLMDDRADLIGLVRSRGTVADGDHALAGPPLLRRADVFGARDWFVLDGGAAWYIQERGGIGYPRNVTSAGIKATGWSAPFDLIDGALHALVRAARALHAECQACGLAWQDIARRRQA